MPLELRSRRALTGTVCVCAASLLAFALLAPAAACHAQQPARHAGEPEAAPLSPQRAARELLNSERIEQAFGSYGIEVLRSDDTLRVSNLYSGSDSARTCRTFAVVFYPPRVDAAFAAEHREILDGGSIGAVLMHAGWTVTKRHLSFGEIESSATLAELMRLEGDARLALHVYLLSISKGDKTFEYAALAEIHHPDYLQARDLPRIYGPARSDGAADAERVRRVLAATREAMADP